MLSQSNILPGYFRFIGFDISSGYGLNALVAPVCMLAVLASIAAGCQLFPETWAFPAVRLYRLIVSQHLATLQGGILNG